MRKMTFLLAFFIGTSAFGLSRQPLGLVNLEGYHGGPSLNDRSSVVLWQYNALRDSPNLSYSETLQNSPNLTVRGIDNPRLQQMAYLDLRDEYFVRHRTPSNINEHLPVLRKYAKECSSALELGVGEMIAIWGIFLGLSENAQGSSSYTGIDMQYPIWEALQRAKRLAEGNDIAFRFIAGNHLNMDIEPADLLFIDTIHTYVQLTYELEKFSPKILKYILMHDTSGMVEYNNDPGYTGNYSNFPEHIDRTKAGMWPAVVDFLKSHPEWRLQERHLNNYGLTVLKRVTNS